MRSIVLFFCLCGWLAVAFADGAVDRQVEERSLSNRFEVRFGFDRYDIAVPMQAQLQEFVGRYVPEKGVFKIIGYTDAKGDAFYNMILSQRRAKSVMQLLQAQGIQASRLLLQPKGEFTTHEEDSPDERKVEVVYIPSGEI